MHWTEQPVEQLEEIGGPWRVVCAAPWFKLLPSLRQKALGQRAVLAFPKHAAPLLLLRLPRSCAALADTLFRAEAVGSSKAWVIALQAGQGESLEGSPKLPSGPARLNWREGGWPEVCWGNIRLGCGCHPLARDWAWAWTPTYGPVLLRLYLGASLEEIGSAVEAHCPGVWQPGPDGYLYSQLSQDSRMRQAPGYLALSRGYLKPPERQVEADYFLLTKLAGGALGELEFDLLDGDYVRFVASGDSAGSLWNYLHARASRSKPHAWNRFLQLPLLDARAHDLDRGAALISEALGWGSQSLDSFLERLATTPVRQLPRHVQVRVTESIWGQAVWDRFLAAQPRVLFTWRLES